MIMGYLQGQVAMKNGKQAFGSRSLRGAPTMPQSFLQFVAN